MRTKLLNSANEWWAVIVDNCCRVRGHIRDGHRDDGVDRMSAVLRGKLSPIMRLVEVQEDQGDCPAWSPRGVIQLQPRLYCLPERLRAALRLNSELVVNGATQPLLAAEVSFCCLNRDVPEQELNLVEFSAGKVA